MPKVSVIIPNYNHAQYLSQRIESVLSQSFNDFEVIILDDNSSDNSREIIDKYKHDFRISNIVYNKINSGSTFRQWRKGIELAKGEWIWFAESDDWCDASLLKVLMNNASKNPECIISYCQSYYREEGSSIIRTMLFHTNSVSNSHWLNDYENKGEHEIKNFLLYKNTIPNASAVIFRKEAFLQVDKSFEKMKMCGDWFLWVQLLKIGDIAFCCEPLNNFRAHSATTRILDSFDKKRQRLEEEYEVVLDIKQSYKDLSIEANKRMKEIVAEYSFYFENNKHIALPYLYKGKLPYSKLLFHKVTNLVNRVRKITKK